MTETPMEQDPIDPLGGQVAVVTGAARGIGEAIALRLARMGAAVVLTARDSARLTQVKAAIEQQAGKAIALPCDLMDAGAVAAFGERVQEQCGRCDILVNNAGIGVLRKPLIDLPVEEWDQMMDTNLRAPYLMIRSLAPMMIAARSGHISTSRRSRERMSSPTGPPIPPPSGDLTGSRIRSRRNCGNITCVYRS